MPDSKEAFHFESGCATTPPSVCYSLLDSPSEEFSDYSAATSRNSLEQNIAAVIQTASYSSSNCSYQKIQSPCISDPTPCPNPSLSATSKALVTSYSVQSPEYSADHSQSHLSPVICSSSFANSYNNNNFNSNSKTIDNFNNIINSNNNNNNNSNNNITEFTFNCKTSLKKQEDFYKTSEAFNSGGHLAPIPFDSSIFSKPVSFSTPKNTINYSNSLLPSKSQLTQESIDLYLDKTFKLKKNTEETHLFLKSYKDEHFEELHQFLLKNGGRIKNLEDINQDVVTDSFLHIFHKKNFQDNLSCDLSDINSVLVSLTSKYNPEEISEFIKKESNEDIKLMNDFLTKIILEREEKRFKSADEKKKIFHKETFDDLSHEIEERKAKRDAMSHYQEDKNHHKRASNYGDYNQWEYFGQQDIQSSNNHNRRGHFSFGGSSQQHSVGWNPMGIGMPRQSNPYYANPHNHMMPAHAHSDYRYNQWNNPNHKNIPNVHNAHSQNTILSQSKVDIKHHADISNSAQDFGLPIGSTSDFSKFRPTSRDLIHRSSSSLAEKSTRTGIHPDHIATISPAIRNSSSIRTPPISGHPKTVINNPLSDLQMLVTNQESENLPQKADNFQQETVDLSAHSDMSKQKENVQNKSLNGKNEEVKQFRSPVSVIQIQNKQIKNDFRESEKPVELTSKCNEKNTEILSPPNQNQLDGKNLKDENVENVKEIIQNEIKSWEEPVKTSVIVGKDGESSASGNKTETDIPENVHSIACKSEEDIKTEEKSENKNDEEKNENKNDEEKIVQQEFSGKSDCLLLETTEAQKYRDSNDDEISKEFSADSKIEISDNPASTRKSKRKADYDQTSGEKKKVLLDVESQQEVKCENVETEKSDLLMVSSTSAEIKPVVNEVMKKTAKKKPLRKSRLGRLSSGQSSGSERSLPCKKSKNSGNKEDSKKRIKKNLCDVMDRRGPFLHVEGSKEAPVSVIVVNFPKGDDEDEKEKSSAKKLTLNANRTKHHNELDFRGRSRNGLYSSTLSARYDARTTDHTWVCVFCKKGPHHNTMGDLFGPYIISKDENVSLGDFSGDEKDISDAQKRGGRNKKSIRSNNMVEHFQKMSRKLRRTQSTESCLTGMTVISDDQVDQLRYEVWVHEQCAVWSPNVFLIGSRIIGMQEAIWCSVKTMCSKCGVSGANIGCVYRNCPNRSHYNCAKESGWSLEQDTFISTCHIHKPRS